MSKPRKNQNPAVAGIQDDADRLLAEIASHKAVIDGISAKAVEELNRVHAYYAAQEAAHKDLITLCDKALQQLMKKNKGILFDSADTVNLPHGSLVRSLADKVSIPRDALAKCEDLGFNEVVKIAKSLDREAIEKWPDERLFLIGAERKPKEEYSYDLKKERADAPKM